LAKAKDMLMDFGPRLNPWVIFLLAAFSSLAAFHISLPAFKMFYNHIIFWTLAELVQGFGQSLANQA